MGGKKSKKVHKKIEKKLGVNIENMYCQLSFRLIKEYIFNNINKTFWLKSDTVY